MQAARKQGAIAPADFLGERRRRQLVRDVRVVWGAALDALGVQIDPCAFTPATLERTGGARYAPWIGGIEPTLWLDDTLTAAEAIAVMPAAVGALVEQRAAFDAREARKRERRQTMAWQKEQWTKRLAARKAQEVSP